MPPSLPPPECANARLRKVPPSDRGGLEFDPGVDPAPIGAHEIRVMQASRGLGKDDGDEAMGSGVGKPATKQVYDLVLL